MSDILPFIFKKSVKMAPNSQILESEELTVQGLTLTECESCFNRMKKVKDK